MENYKVDLAEISEKENQIVGEMMVSVIDNTQTNGGVFIKANFENKKISARQGEPYIKKLISAVLTQAYTLAGIKTEIDQSNAADINRAIINRFSNLTVEEVCKAFELERHLAYGEKTEHFQLFNAEYVATILTKYVKWKRQTMHQQNIELPSNQKSNEVTAEEIRTIKLAGILNCYEDFAESGHVDDFRFNVFDILYDAGIFPKTGSSANSDARYSEIMVQAQGELIQEYAIKKAQSLGKHGGEELKRDYEQIKSGFGSVLNNRCKAIALASYFKKLGSKEKLMEVLTQNLDKI